MRLNGHFRRFLLVLYVFLTLTASTYAFDELQEGRISVMISGGDAYIETLSGDRSGFSPFTQEYYSEIPGILRTSEAEKTTIGLPADQLYGIWLDRDKTESSDSYSIEIRTAEWCAALTDFRNETDSADLLITPISSFSESGPFFDKITLYSSAVALPDFRFEFLELPGTCRMSMDSGFDLGTADPAAAETPAEVVITYYPVDSTISVWAVSAAVETEELFSGCSFLFNINLSCENKDRPPVEKTFSQIDMKENGIFFIDLDDFRSGGSAYFEGDLDGDDVYEVEPCGL